MPQAERRRLLLLGGGHAHLSVLERLAAMPMPDWDVTLVSPYPRQLYSGMLPGWVAGHYAIDETAISLVNLAARARITFHQSAATALDLERREVRCASGVRLGFDLVSIDTGPEPALAELPGAGEHALMLRPIEGFVASWPAIVARWQAQRASFEVVIVGSGAGAVELAFAIHARARRDGATHVRVSLMGRDLEPMTGAAPRARREVMRALHEKGVRWFGSSDAARIEPGTVLLGQGAAIAFDACLVATGAAAPRWPEQAGLATDERGFIRVDRTLRSVSHPCVFAAGDVAALADERPKSGVFAVRAGAALAHNLFAACVGRTLREWHPQRRALYLVSTADGRAIVAWDRWSVSGRWAWRWKDRIDRRFVQRFKG